MFACVLPTPVLNGERENFTRINRFTFVGDKGKCFVGTLYTSLDTITMDNEISNVDLLHANLHALRTAHVDGLMVDVWWGIVEKDGPKCYDWSAYRSLFKLIQSYGFKLQAVMSFHQCGNNAADSCYIPLPGWVCKEAESNPDIFFTNRDSKRNKEYLSFGIDNEPVLNGRTAVEVYRDFMQSFRESMSEFLESGMVAEIEVGLGPAGELRYPSFSNSQGWRFPGIGEFQCYDKYLLYDLKEAAKSIGHNEWGSSGPADAGHYNDWPQATGFFRKHGSFTSDYGRFFLEWYSGVLLKHGDTILEAASEVFEGCKVRLAAKIAGIHWWYKSMNHAAELAAGYYNLRERDGYKPIAKMLARHRAILNFTCIEMRDKEHYWKARCGPEGLVRQVTNAGWDKGIDVSCENALPRFDRAAFDQILLNARPHGITDAIPPKRRVFSFTYLRLGPELMQENHWREFVSFVRRMHAGLDYHPEPDKYFKPTVPLERSKPLKAFLEEPAIPVASVPLDQYHVPLALQKAEEPFFSQDAPGGGLGAQVESSSASFPLNLIAWLWHGTGPSRTVKQNVQSVYQSDSDYKHTGSSRGATQSVQDFYQSDSDNKHAS
ncbi:hypothetical protein KP509_04G008700 [Ceratopteris richardii]|uniref:Beta-amylase n=1 Tax=Ceratopteris richardii TaxID=49495 RepID=A0A8T2USH9_CERRI|nr:hypothetical protein KP509_04G008700 [Ceratopteris richardii]